LAVPALGFTILNLAIGFGPNDVRALGRHWRYRRAPDQVLWNRPEKEGALADFVPLPGGGALVVREGGLAFLEGGEARPLGAAQGVLRLFPGAGSLWVAGTYHRALGWDAARGLRHLANAAGPIREIRGGDGQLAVAVEDSTLDAGHVDFLRAAAPDFYAPEGQAIPIALGRWSGFELSPDGRRMLANLPGGRGVGVWDAATGQRLAAWPAARLARVLAWAGNDQVLFDEGPSWKGREAIYAHPETRLVLARVGAPEPPVAITGNFAMVLAGASDGRRLAFADAEGIIRVVSLGVGPALIETFAARDRGVPWRLRWEGDRLWALFTGETVRLEWYALR
jgi:hypothetical protein